MNRHAKWTPPANLRLVARSWGKPGGRAGLWLAIALGLFGCAAPQVAPPAPALPAPPEPVDIVDDHGRLIVDAMEYPWSALGRVNTGGRGFCTGLLVGPRLVLTTARCLYNGIEGRWWAADEVHFVAGYQRDTALIDSGVARYEVAPAFAAGAGTSLANVTNNWALLTLEAPIGRHAGWLAVQWLGREARRRLRRGAGLVLQAGYRRDWAHSLTVKLGCAGGQSLNPTGGRGRACGGPPENPELPFLLFLDDEFRVLGNHFLLARAAPGGTARTAFGALRRNGPLWGESRAPSGRGPAAPLPRKSIARLLRHLGHLSAPAPTGDGAGNAAGDAAVLEAAIRRFEQSAGLPESGAPSVALLGRLIEAARRSFAAEHEPKISLRTHD